MQYNTLAAHRFMLVYNEIITDYMRVFHSELFI